MQKPVLAAFLSVSGTSLSDAEKRLFEKYNPCGVSLFNRNLESADQAKTLVAQIKEAIGRDDVFIAADQEGGRVNRLAAAGFGDYASARTLGLIDDLELTRVHARLMAADMQSVGVNFNYAPVLDVIYPQTTAALLGRSFGSDAGKIVRHGQELIKAFSEVGICPCMKHLPGHGRAENDPHLGLPVIDASLSDLAQDFYPFEQLADCPSAMTAHIVLEQVDPKNPITLSFKGIKEIIRGRIGFDGLLISDALDMRALKGTIAEKATAAWRAGCDIVCYCGGNADEMEALCKGGVFLDLKPEQRYQTAKRILQNRKSIKILECQKKRYYSSIDPYGDNDINYDATEVLHQMLKGE